MQALFNFFFFISLIVVNGKTNEEGEKKITREENCKTKMLIFFGKIFSDRRQNSSKFADWEQPPTKHAPSLSSISVVFVHGYEHVSSVCGHTEDKMEGAVFVAMRDQVFLPLLAEQKLAGYSSCGCVPHCFDFVSSEWLLQSSPSLRWDLKIFSVKANKNGDLFYCRCLNTVGVCLWIQGIRSPFLGLWEMPPAKSLEKRQQFKFHIRFPNITSQCLFSGLLLSPVILFSYFLIWQPLCMHVNDDSNASEAVVFNFY